MKHHPKNFLTSAVQESEIPYQRKFEECIIRHCTPTLAGIKPANLFTCRDESVPGLRGNNPYPVDSKTHQKEFSKRALMLLNRLSPMTIPMKKQAPNVCALELYLQVSRV